MGKIDHGEVDDRFYILRRIAYYDCENEVPGHEVTIRAAELRELFEVLDKATLDAQREEGQSTAARSAANAAIREMRET